MENIEYFGDRAVAKWLHSPLPGELDLKKEIFIRTTIFIWVNISLDSNLEFGIKWFRN